MSEVKYPMTDQDYIDDIMDCFDFEKVHKAMNALKWWWASTNGVPEMWEIKQSARERIKSAMLGLSSQQFNNGMRTYGSSTGGFTAMATEWDDGCKTVELSFVVSSWDSSNYDR